MLASLRTPDGGSFGAWPGEFRAPRREPARREAAPRRKSAATGSRPMAQRAPAPLWDNPRLLLWLANLLFAASALLLLYAGFFLAVHLALFPLREVRVQGALRNVIRDQVESVARRHVSGNFFTADLDAVRRAFEAMPWVRSVNVRRVWPDRLEVSIEEHRAVARWKDEALVNSHGELFAGETGDALPVLDGPPGSAAEVERGRQRFAELLAPIGRRPDGVRLSARGAWQLTLDDGTSLQLGREQVEQRLARFVAAYPLAVGALGTRLRAVDLRYGNGFAVRAASGNATQGAGT